MFNVSLQSWNLQDTLIVSLIAATSEILKHGGKKIILEKMDSFYWRKDAAFLLDPLLIHNQRKLSSEPQKALNYLL